MNYPLFLNYSHLSGISAGSLNVFAIIQVPVQFDDVCIELDLLVAKDRDLRYDLLIGRNVIGYPDVELVTYLNGCRLRRKSHLGLEIVNTVNVMASPLCDLRTSIDNLNRYLQDEDKSWLFFKTTLMF